jgi:hypothetical protein
VQSFYFLADLHSLIKSQDAQALGRSTREIAATWLALGLDTERVVFYRQSDVPEITELTWMLTCMTAKGLMNRAHAYKAAVQANQEAGQDDDFGITHGPVQLPGADGGRHPDVQRRSRARGSRPDPARRDGARHRAALQPPLRRALRAADRGRR